MAMRQPAANVYFFMRTTISILEIKGTWNITKGILRQAWAGLTDNGLGLAEGKQDELLGRVQRSTGETREALKMALMQSAYACSLRLRPIRHSNVESTRL